jgi:uncharacterized protein (DUF1919 family)
MKEKLTKLVKRNIARLRVRRRDFTIVSNNCWGAHVYQICGEPYRTPFVGLFFAPACFVSLVQRFRWYMGRPLQFIGRSRHESINRFREEGKLTYPIGLLGDDVEIQFLHYKSPAEATEKWNRRVERIIGDDSRLYFKFCDRDGCSPEQLAAFDAAPLAHKVCFVSRPMPELKSAVWIPESTGGQVPDGLQLSYLSPKYFDAASWLNGGGGKPEGWAPRVI